jgi:uncharacterized protein GlcG (DUF336 family)
MNQPIIFWRNTMIRSYALAAVVGLAALPGTAALSAEALPIESHKVIPAALAVEAAQAAIAACKAQGYNVTVTVADRLGQIQVMIIGDNASRMGRELSRRKAYTSALQRITTGDLNKRVSVPGAYNPTIYDTQLVIERGGVPIKVGDDTIGAIAVSGAPGGEKDEACAEAGIAKLGDRLH